MDVRLTCCGENSSRPMRSPHRSVGCEVLEFLTRNLHMLEHGDHAGVVSFFYSVLLSKGIDAIYSEMDNKGSFMEHTVGQK